MAELNLSVRKAITLLRLIGQARNGCTLTELSQHSGLALTICHRLLATLEFEGLIDRARDTGKFTLGAGLIGLAGRALHSNSIQSAILASLETVVLDLHDAGLLMVPDRYEAICVARVESDNPTNVVGTRVGTRTPLHCGGAPFAILAFSSDEFIEAYLSRPLEKRTEKTIVDPAIIRTKIMEARFRGYAVGDEDLFPYIVAVGVPVFEPDGRLFGAVSLGHLKRRYDTRKISQVAAKLREQFPVPAQAQGATFGSDAGAGMRS